MRNSFTPGKTKVGLATVAFRKYQLNKAGEFKFFDSCQWLFQAEYSKDAGGTTGIQYCNHLIDEVHMRTQGIAPEM